MKSYEFTLAFALPASGVDVDDYIERLGESDCDDAIVGVGRRARIALSFVREADSAQNAVLHAIANVRRAIPDAALIEASPDLVGFTDVADLLHVSRQNVRKLLFNSEALAPAPVHEGRPSIWRLAKVLHWLREQKGYPIDEDLVALAEATMQVNLAVDVKDAVRSSQEGILALLA